MRCGSPVARAEAPRFGRALAITRALVIACACAGCPAANNPQPCPSGICPGPVDRDGPPAPDLAGTCVETWFCGPWAAMANGLWSRICVDNNHCGTTLHEPPTGPLPLPSLDLDYFKCKVEPILDRGCAMLGCHGTKASDSTHAFRVFARGRRRNQELVPPIASCGESTPQDLEQTGSGTILCQGATLHTPTEWQMNFDSARSLLLGVPNPDDCDLLAQPVVGGKSHSGVHLFGGKTDPDYVTIRSWLAGAALGTACDPQN
jgi:hypothetical protein